MKTALIGYTGFVGSNIAKSYIFDDFYNTSNIKEIEGKTYDLVVSAANRAEMWRINQEPEKDKVEINEYIDHIKQLNAKKFVLISTVGVYKNPISVDEDTEININGLLPYGVNRFNLEQFCMNTFDTLVVRLPGLFGKGIKKNVIYDLLYSNNVDRIHYAGEYQYYNLENTWKDINIALDNNLKLINFASQPVRTDEIANYCFGIDNFNNEPSDVQPAHFDMQTKHAALYGNSGRYIYSKEQEMNDIRRFVQEAKNKT